MFPISSISRLFSQKLTKQFLLFGSLSLTFFICLRPLKTQPQYNYGEALQKAILFYEAQQAGKLPDWNRVPWRGDAALEDGADVGIDLTGGWFDAGDHVKFGFPMAATVTALAWGGSEYYEAYEQSGQLTHLSRNIKWVTDYLLKAFANDTPGQYVLYGQVGNGNQDHHWWGPAEVVDYEMERPAYKIDTSCPGSDLAAETAAALASASIFFRETGELDYANLLLQKAERLYDFADQYRGKYSDCLKEAVPFYTSFSGYQDELVWGAIWLHRAKEAQRSDYGNEYLEKAILEYQSMSKPYNYTFITDDKSYGAYVLLAIATGDEQYRERANNWLDYWTIGYQGEKIRYTPGGLAFLAKWGSLHLAANTAFVGFIYSDWLRSQGYLEQAERYFNFGVGQINYILGNNPSNRSYLIGFGDNYPQNPHHRTSHGSWSDDSNNPSRNRNLLVGALVGGPDENDQWQDDRNDWVQNEVAISYNAGLVGALARMYLEFGGESVEAITIPTETEPQMYIEAEVKNKGADFIDIRAYIVNKSASPAQGLDNASMRFFFTLDSLNLNDLSISSSYNECGEFYSEPVQVSENLYYVEISCNNNLIYPGGESDYKKQIDLRISSNRQWDNSLQWIIKQLTSNWQQDGIKTTNITLYEDGELIWGKEPNSSSIVP
jgi:hypothetical protein